MLKVILIKSNLNRIGGLEKYTWQIAERFCQENVEVTLLTTGSPTPPFEHPALKIHSFPIAHALSVFNLLHFDRACHTYLQKHPTSIVFSLDRCRFQTHHRAGNGSHAAYLKRRAQEEGWWKRQSFAFNPLHSAILRLEKKTFEHPALKVLFTNSQMVKEEILNQYAIDPDKIAVVHNGVEWMEKQGAFDRWEEEKERFCPRRTTHELLFIGHNYQRKGLEKLLNALALLPKEDFHLSVVGKEKNLRYFQRGAERRGLSQKVSFLGPQPSSLPFYQMADTLIIPSLYDPFANVTVEALSMGLFVLSSAHNGGKEVLTPETGCIIPDLDDTSQFAALLRQTFEKRKTAASSRAIRGASRHLDFSLQLKKIVDLTLRA